MSYQRHLASGRIITVNAPVHRHTSGGFKIRELNDPEINSEVDRVIRDMPNRKPDFDVIGEASRRVRARRGN